MKAKTRIYPCENCPIRRSAEANPGALLARLWRWHITWCPSWKAYQRGLARQAAGAMHENIPNLVSTSRS